MESGKYGLQLYILVDKHIVPAPSVLEWAAWRSDIKNTRIALDKIAGSEISTVFLGIPSFSFFDAEDAPPRGLFETMIFSEDTSINHWQRKSDTYEQALATHQLAKETILIQHH